MVWQDLATRRLAMATLTLLPLRNLCNYQKVAYVGQGGPMQLCSPLFCPHSVFLSQINKFFTRIQNECRYPYIMHSCSPFVFWNICTIGIFLITINLVAFPAK